jgi:hypothetical protein
MDINFTPFDLSINNIPCVTFVHDNGHMAVNCDFTIDGADEQLFTDYINYLAQRDRIVEAVLVNKAWIYHKHKHLDKVFLYKNENLRKRIEEL